MTIGGAIHIYTAYGFYQLSLTISNFFPVIVTTLMMAFGLLSFGTSLAIWLQKPWAKTMITSIGIASCGVLVIFQYYLVGFFFALIYWAVLNYIKTNRVAQPSDLDDN